MKYWSAHAKKHRGNAGRIEPANEQNHLYKYAAGACRNGRRGVYPEVWRALSRPSCRSRGVGPWRTFTTCKHDQAVPLEKQGIYILESRSSESILPSQPDQFRLTSCFAPIQSPSRGALWAVMKRRTIKSLIQDTKLESGGGHIYRCICKREYHVTPIQLRTTHQYSPSTLVNLSMNI